jgi:hypothetical protein
MARRMVAVGPLFALVALFACGGSDDQTSEAPWNDFFVGVRLLIDGQAATPELCSEVGIEDLWLEPRNGQFFLECKHSQQVVLYAQQRSFVDMELLVWVNSGVARRRAETIYVPTDEDAELYVEFDIDTVARFNGRTPEPE